MHTIQMHFQVAVPNIGKRFWRILIKVNTCKSIRCQKTPPLVHMPWYP